MEQKNDNNSNYLSLFQTTNSITSSFAKLKFVTIACIVGMVVCAGFCVFWSTTKVSELSNKIYIVDRGQAFTATRADRSVSRADEIRFQSKELHRLLFTVTPSRNLVTKNIEDALKISDNSVYKYFRDVDETGYYRRMAQTGSFQEIVVDSVRTDTRRYPYPVITYATLYITRPSVMQVNRLESVCYMQDITPNVNNLNGLRIEKFEVRRNEKIEERKR